MNKCSKKWLLAAAILIAAGAIIFFAALAANDFDFKSLSTQKFQTNTYELDGDFENICINVETASVAFVPSDEDVCKIECYEEEKSTHSAKIQDGTLTVYSVDNRKWYDYISFGSWHTPAITVYLPKDVYNSLSVTTHTGNIEVPDRYSFETVTITGTTSNINCHASVTKTVELNTTTGKITLGSSQPEKIKLSASTGSITVIDVACNNLTAENSTGQIYLKNVIAKESIRAKNSTGGVRFEKSDAQDITVKTSTGSVKGTLLSEKIFAADTSTGRISVPKSSGGGTCDITTSTGDIEIEIE